MLSGALVLGRRVVKRVRSATRSSTGSPSRLSTPSRRRVVRDLAARFAAEGFVAEALPLAEASCDLRRIREIRDALVWAVMTPSSPEDRRTSITNLGRLERYERRARSRVIASLRAIFLA